MFGRLPEAVQLRFLESGLIGSHRPAEKAAGEARAAIKAAAAGIRARVFTATPSFQACGSCAYNQVCPYTVTRE